MKKLLCALLFVLSFILVGCTDAEWASTTSVGSEFSVELFSAGEIVRTWTSTGKVITGEHGARYAFVDKETGKYVRVGVSNTVVTQK